MSIVWHIVKKDFRRLKMPLVLWGLFLIAEGALCIYAGGAFATPDLVWLGRMGGPTEMFIRMFMPPLVVYLLAAWLVYGDPLVESDPFWITRPISGGQLFAAKLLGGILMFVLPPVLTNLAWWLGCGFGWSEIMPSAGTTAAVFAVPVIVGIGLASVTDSFQRYILWSLVAFALYVVWFNAFSAVITTLMTPRLSSPPGSMFNTSLVGACLLALIIGGHQFHTRRLARSIGLAVIVAAVVSMAAAAGWVALQPARTNPPVASDLEKMQLAVIEPARVSRGLREAKNINLRLRADDLPGDAVLTEFRLQAAWRDGDRVVWSAQTARGYSTDMVKAAAGHLLGVTAKTASPSDRIMPASVPMAAASLQQITERPAIFRGVADFTVLRGKILVEMPLREVSQRTKGRSFSISRFAIKPLNETALQRSARLGEANDGNAISLTLTERMVNEQVRGFEFGKWRMPPTVYAILRRSTGEIVFSDAVATGPTGFTYLNQVFVLSMGIQFVPPSTKGWLDDATLAVVRFDSPQTLQRILTANPLALEMTERPRATAP